MTNIHVSATREYNVIIENGIINNSASLISEVVSSKKVCIISDDTVYGLYGSLLTNLLSEAGFEVLSFVFEHGEASKNPSTYLDIINYLAENKLTRKDTLIALGGGVVGDITGFAAATYLRGIKFIQIPTTLLACVDSSVGGKTAVDLPAGKNLLGAFWQPSLVICDPTLLSTLPREIFSDGMAEVIKYAILVDREFFDYLSDNSNNLDLEYIISVCVKIKRDIVNEDEFDNKIRQLLNLGHTLGHSVEALSDFTVSHGSAVAIGMCLITRAAVDKGLCHTDDLTLIENILKVYNLPIYTEMSAEDVFRVCLNDKKMGVGSISLIVPSQIGKCNIIEVPTNELKSWVISGGLK